MVSRLIIDTDAGVDDAIAILLALASPAHTVAAITTLSGNVEVDKVVRNVGIILDAARADEIPIFRGAALPLTVDQHHAAQVHGEDGLGDAGFRPSRRPIEKEDAVGALVRMARGDPRGYELVRPGSPLRRYRGRPRRERHRAAACGGAAAAPLRAPPGGG